MKRLALLTIAFGLLCAQAPAADRLTYVDLVKRLTALDQLAVLPAEGDTCAQWSSYDRRSKYDEATGTYVGWSANGDGNGCIRREGDGTVMAEMDGPGCIWRIWSALAQAGHVKVYLDGAAEPAVDLPFDGYFNGKQAPFVHPSLVHTTARGRNNYVPIPYRKSCKIVADKGWGRYFQFVYETFPKGTEVPTFKRDLSAEETAALAAANEALTTGLGADPAGKRSGEETVKKGVTLGGGKSETVAKLDGPRAVTAIRIKMDLPDEKKDEVKALRELAIRITWDGEARPSVWAPLNDFFGTAGGVNLYKSLPLGITDDEFYCLWYMPFARSALVELINDGEAERRLDISVTHAPLARPVAGLGRFHAKWHRDAFLPEDADRRKIDWTMLKTEGRGRFCGVMLHVWNPRGGWWGEGDEKFFVDGETFPSTIGTGSEDYFGYAWCCPDLFQNCYHCQTISSGNRGHVSVSRWHIADNIPFQKSFEGAIEKYYPNSKPTLYACIAYWYQAPGGNDPYEPVAVADRIGYAKPPEPRIVKGAIEAETMNVVKKTGGNVRPQPMGNYAPKWSSDCQMWWTHGKPGDRLELEVPVKKSGKYKVSTNLTKAIDYAIIQLYLDETKLGSPIDCWNDGVIATGPIGLGTHDLEAGKHTFGLVITGANPKMKPGHMAGVDYVKLEPAE